MVNSRQNFKKEVKNLEQELIYSNKNGALHKRPRLTKLIEARKKAGYKSQYEIAKDLGITQTKYCSYESGKKEMPEKIANKLSALLNISVKEIKSVDYASAKLSKEAVEFLNKAFKLLGDLTKEDIFRLETELIEFHKINWFVDYYHSFEKQLEKMSKKKAKEIKSKFNKEDSKLLFGNNITREMVLNPTIHYNSIELLFNNGLLKESQLMNFIQYFNIIQ